jgi:PAS domain-containing protein
LIVHSEIDHRGRTVTTVIGAIDLDSTPRLVDSLRRSPVAPDVVDLRFVSFLSASALRSLLTCAPPRIVASTAVRRMVTLCGPTDLDLIDPTDAPSLDRIDAGVSVHDASGRYLYINDELAAINGRPAAEHLGRTPGDLWRIERDGVMPILRHVVAHQEPYHVVVEGMTATGAPTTWDCWYHPARHRLAGRDEPVVVALVRPDPTVRHDRRATLRFSVGATAS